MPVSGAGYGWDWCPLSVTLGQHGLEVDLASGTPGTQESELYLAVTRVSHFNSELSLFFQRKRNILLRIMGDTSKVT